MNLLTLTAHFSEEQNGWNGARLDENMRQVAELLQDLSALFTHNPFSYIPIGFSVQAHFTVTMHDWASRSDGDKLVMANNTLYAFLEMLKRENIAVSAVQIEYTDSEGRKRGIFYR